MKLATLCLIILFCTINTYAEWTQRVGRTTMRANYKYGNHLFIGQINGITEYNLSNSAVFDHFPINSPLKGAYVNSIVPLDDEQALVSTNGGLSLLYKGVLTNDNVICESYPDTDARYVYIDKNDNIWTFSAEKVHVYTGNAWRSFNIREKTDFPIEIMELYIQNDKVWASFNDISLTSTRFYYSSVSDERRKLAVLNVDGIIATYKNKLEFPYRQGSTQLSSIGDTLLLFNNDSTYTFANNKWESTTRFVYAPGFKINLYSQVVEDENDNIWYSLIGGDYCFPVSYNKSTGAITRHFEAFQDKWIPYFQISKHGYKLAYSRQYLYINTNGVWLKKSFVELGLDSISYVSQLPETNDGLFIYIFQSPSYQRGTIYNIDKKEVFANSDKAFPYTTVDLCAVNKFGKAMLKGKLSITEQLRYETDSGFVRPNLVSDNVKVMPANDGNVYFTHLRVVDSAINNPYISTWIGNQLINKSIGFLNDPYYSLVNLDIYDEFAIAIGGYRPHDTIVHTTLSILNLSDNSLETYDKFNSCMPDFYYIKYGSIYFQQDTAVKYVAMDANKSVWINTTYSLINFQNGNCQIYDIPKDVYNNPIYTSNMFYDKKFNELIFTFTNTDTVIYIYNINNNTWTEVLFDKMGLLNSYTKIKKLIDNNIWASDSKGYMYNYAGNGTFKVFDLQFFGKQNLGITINDFSLDVNNNIHLGTDVGLFSNMITTSVEGELMSQGTNLNVFPNPSTEYIYLKLNQMNGNFNFENCQIFNTMGDRFSPKISIFEDGLKIDIQSLPQGFYFVKVDSEVASFIKINN